jgi:hypothetical protein
MNQPRVSDARVAVDRAVLNLAINMLRRDAEAGKPSRGEVADLLENGAALAAPAADEPVDCDSNAAYIEHCAAKLTALGFPIMGRTLHAIAAEHAALAAQAPPPVVGDAVAWGCKDHHGIQFASEDREQAVEESRRDGSLVVPLYAHPAPAGLTGEELEALEWCSANVDHPTSEGNANLSRVFTALRRFAAAQGREG